MRLFEDVLLANHYFVQTEKMAGISGVFSTLFALFDPLHFFSFFHSKVKGKEIYFRWSLVYPGLSASYMFMIASSIWKILF